MSDSRPPLVSVIIPTFNRARLLQRAVASVLAQSCGDLEIIVVDDGSSDDSRELLRHNFAERVKVLPLGRNLGVSAARNRGLLVSRGEFIALLDSDDYWRPAKLEKQLAFMRARPELLLSQTDEIWIRHGRRVNPCRHHRKPDGWIYSACLPLCVVSPSAVMMRREFFFRVGLFDENLPACEDYDLWLRAACRYPVALLPEPLVVKHGGHADQLSRTVPALDRFRIMALLKIIRSGCLSPSQLQETRSQLQVKATIYLNGCRKRGRPAAIPGLLPELACGSDLS